MKKIGLLCLLIGLLAMLALPATAAQTSGICGDNLRWAFDEASGTLTISGDGSIYNWGGTGTAAWYPHRNAIKKIVMSGTVTSISVDSFKDCPNLTDVVFSDGLQVIFDGAFQGCTSLETVTLPDTVISIGEEVFQGCVSLRKITMSKALKRVGQWAFSGCSSLEEIHFAGAVPTIYGEVKTDKVLTVYYPAGITAWNETNMEIFKETFPETTIFVGVGEPFVPATGVGGTTVGGFIWLLGDGVLTISGNGMMYFDPMLTMGGMELAPWYEYRLDVKEVVVMPGVTGLDARAFQHCKNLTKVTLPDTMQSVSEQMFHGCESLTSIDIPSGVTTIGTAAFRSCVNLKKITIPESVTLIKDEAFAGCATLEEVSFMGCPEMWTCFQGCTSLKTLKFYGDASLLRGTLMEGVTATAYYPAGNPTWTKDRLIDYGGKLTWVSFGCTKHTEVADAAIKASCITIGKTAGAHCSVCGAITKAQQVIPATGHSFGSWKQTKAPTTQAVGQETRSCKNCNAVEQREIPKLTQQTPNPTDPKPTEPNGTQPNPTDPTVVETVPPTVPGETQLEGTEPESTTATDPDEEPTQPSEPEPPKSTPWVAIAIAGGMILAGGGAAAWYFVLRKRK